MVPTVLYGGALGGGKSYYGCRRMIAKAENHPGYRGYLCRAESAVFKRTTLQTLLNPAPEGVDILSRHGWTHKISEQFFVHVNGSRLDYGGLAGNEDREKVKSMNLTGAYVDEASEVDLISALMLESRCARQVGLEPYADMLYTSNPEPCWLQTRFIDNTAPGCAFVQALPTDNPHLDPGYLEHVARVYADMPELLEAYLHGSWAAIGTTDKVCPPALVNAAMSREVPEGEPCEWGVDVARMGDDLTKVYERRGGRVRKIAEYAKQDTRTTSDAIAALYGLATVKPTAIKVDDIGVGGAVTDNLKHARLPVFGINVGASAYDASRFANLKAEVNWHLRTLLEEGYIGLPNDETLRGDLTATKYLFRSGRLVVESKDEVKKRLGRSPDDGDAIVLCFAPLPPTPTFSIIVPKG